MGQTCSVFFSGVDCKSTTTSVMNTIAGEFINKCCDQGEGYSVQSMVFLQEFQKYASERVSPMTFKKWTSKYGPHERVYSILSNKQGVVMTSTSGTTTFDTINGIRIKHLHRSSESMDLLAFLR